MGLFRRRTTQHEPVRQLQVSQPSSIQVVRFSGSHDLDVVGESFYQDALWQCVGGWTSDRVRVEIEAVLVAEPDKPRDSNAISVWISGMRVGYLSREDAAEYRNGLVALQARHHCHVALGALT